MKGEVELWSNGESGYWRVRVTRTRSLGKPHLLLEAAGRSMEIPVAHAFQLASGIDAAIARIDRGGKQITTPAGSAENGDAPPLRTAGRL